MHAPTEVTPALQAVPTPPPATKEPTGLGCLVIVARHHGMHLTVPQLIRDNVLSGDEVSSPRSSIARVRSNSRPKRCSSTGMALRI